MVIKVNYGKTVILITIQNSFFVKLQKYDFDFRSSQNNAFSFFSFTFYQMVDKKTLKISIGKIIRLVPNHLKAKKMCKIAVKKLPSVIKYVSDQYKSNEM